MKAIMSVAVMTPFFFIGFDVIPQAAEEINVPLKKIGMIMILSIVLASSVLDVRWKTNRTRFHALLDNEP